MFKQNGPITFIVGIGIGSVGGFVLGAILGKYALNLVSLLIGVLDRRDGADEKRLKFELLLQ